MNITLRPQTFSPFIPCVKLHSSFSPNWTICQIIGQITLEPKLQNESSSSNIDA